MMGIEYSVIVDDVQAMLEDMAKEASTSNQVQIIIIIKEEFEFKS